MKRAVPLMLFAAAACAGPRPMPPQAASVTAPQDWRDGAPSRGTVDSKWWLGFGDPVMAQLVERALVNNVDIAIAASRVEEARAQFRLARADQLPDVGGCRGRRP